MQIDKTTSNTLAKTRSWDKDALRNRLKGQPLQDLVLTELQSEVRNRADESRGRKRRGRR